MSQFEGTAIIAVFAILAAVTLCAWRRWLPPGKMRTVLYTLAGAGVIVLLWSADIPPDWFDGAGEGWWIAGTFLAMAFVGDGGVKSGLRAFLLSLGIALAAFNVWAHL
jgi:hypothetical protein